jgi:hypothetical protein
MVYFQTSRQFDALFHVAGVIPVAVPSILFTLHELSPERTCEDKESVTLSENPFNSQAPSSTLPSIWS